MNQHRHGLLKTAARNSFVALTLAVAPGFAQDEAPPPEDTAIETIPVEPPAEPEADAAPPVTESEGATSLDTIEVTGSRIKRTDFESAQPVLVITRKDIERTGLTSIGDLLQEIAAAGGGALNTAYNNGGNGSVQVDLRNLGPSRVLVLVNGHRWVNGLQSNATSTVDLTTIPISLIERVEVLKDGASAIYGSDAIAGVVNVITRKDYQGLDLGAYVGAFDGDEGIDGWTQSHNVSWGKLFGATSVFLDGSYTRQEPIFADARDNFKILVPGTGKTRGSGATPQGHYLFVPSPETEAQLRAVDPNSCPGLVPVDTFPVVGAIGAVPLCNVTTREGTPGAEFGDMEPFQAALHNYETSPSTYLLTPSERMAVVGQIGHQLTTDIGIRGEFLYNRRESAQELAAQPLFLGDLIPFPFFNPVYVAADNPFNPFGQDVGRGQAGVLTPGSGATLRRPIELSDRIFNQAIDTWRAALNVGGPFDLSVLGFERLVTWELGYQSSESKDRGVTQGLFDVAKLALAAGPVGDCTADPECVPINLMGGQSAPMTPEMLEYVTYTDIARTRQRMQNAWVGVSTELVRLPAGPLGFAIGAEYREEDYRNIPDLHVQNGTSSTNRARRTEGKYDVQEYFTELSVPLLRDLPGVRELDLSIAGRYSDYGDIGNAETGKLGLRYKPFDDLLLRGTASTAFRAPSVGELFLGNTDSFTGLADPCDAQNRGADANADANCTSDAVNPTLVQLVPQLIEILRGNPDLKPETAETFTAGLVYSPSWLADFNFYVDWYSISIEDYISVPGAQAILDYCYKANPDERIYCEKVNRDPVTGAIIDIDDPFLNYASLDTRGVDVALDYQLPWFEDWGTLKFVTDASYLDEYKLLAPGPGGQTIRDDNFKPGRHYFFTLSALPRWKGNATLEYALGALSASYTVRYVHRLMENCFDGIPPSLRDLGLCSHPDFNEDDPATVPDESLIDNSENELEAVLYHSFQAGYKLPWWGERTKLTVGMNNLLDQDPPVSYSASPLYGFEPSTYEIPGRFGYLRINHAFQ